MARLLVVDDEAQILELLSLTLSMQGFEVVTARSGPEALARCGRGCGCGAQGGYQAVVMDVLMAPWDGFETVRRLREHCAAHLPPVVFLSGLNRAHDVPELGPGIQFEYLLKPFRPAQLLEVLRRLAES